MTQPPTPPGPPPTPPGPPPTPPGPPPVPASQPGDQALWAVLAHLSYFVLPLLGPLVIMLAVGPTRPFARANAVEALNFHLTIFLAGIVALLAIVIVIGLVLLPLLYVYAVVLTVVAAVKVGQGQVYRYPLTWRPVT